MCIQYFIYIDMRADASNLRLDREAVQTDPRMRPRRLRQRLRLVGVRRPLWHLPTRALRCRWCVLLGLGMIRHGLRRVRPCGGTAARAGPPTWGRHEYSGPPNPVAPFQDEHGNDHTVSLAARARYVLRKLVRIRIPTCQIG